MVLTWAAKAQKTLTPWRLVFFGMGPTADASGTSLVSLIASANRAAEVESSILNQIVAVSGIVALVLKAVYFAWAIIVFVRDRAAQLPPVLRRGVGYLSRALRDGALGSSLE